jgi:UDP-N-acetylglucosamine acyltransferase
MIHPTALVDPGADIAADVEIGAFAVIEERVTIASGCRVEPHAQVLAGTRIGRATVVGRAAVLGGEPQDLSFDAGTESFLEIGEGNTIREHVTVHRSASAGGATRIGDNNFIMVGAHMGHDTLLGNNNVVANNCLLAGHVVVGDHCFLGGGSVYHQFIRVGDRAMAQGNGAFSKDIPPFTIAALYNQLIGLNSVGLRRAGVSPQERGELRGLFAAFFRDGRRLEEVLVEVQGRDRGACADTLIAFMAAPSSRGVCTVSPKGSSEG